MRTICVEKFISFFVQKRFSGHSKWANIRHIKAEKDGQRSTLFLRFSQRMRVAIQEGGSSNPKNNLALAHAIEIAKKNNMPMASIQNVIKSNEKDHSKMKAYTLDIRGPKGTYIIVLLYTDIFKKVRDNVVSILKKSANVSLTEQSGRNHLFNYKGVIDAVSPANNFNIDEATNHAIECGAEEVFQSDVEPGQFQFVCEPNSLDSVKRSLEELKYDVTDAEVQYIPITRITLENTDLENLSKLYDKLEGLPEVAKLYDNIA